MAFIDERVADAVHEKAKALSAVRAWDTGDDTGVGKVAARQARQAQDPEVAASRQSQLDAYAYRKLLEARHEAFVRDAAVVSRELTRRVDRDGPVRRNDRWNAGA